MNVTDLPCSHCKESDTRDMQYLVELPRTTKKQRLKVRVCPFCDSKELLKLAGRDNEPERPSIP